MHRYHGLMSVPAIVCALLLCAHACVQPRTASAQVLQEVRATVPKRLFSLASDNGSEPAHFASITWALSRPDGSGYVYDGRSERLLQFDARGKFVCIVGREGRGNGAFAHLAGGAVVGDSLLAVWDVTNQRIVLFNERCEWTRNVALPMAARGYVSHSAELQFTADTAGFFYARIQTRMASKEFHWLRLSADGVVRDSFPDARHPSIERYTSDGMRSTFGGDTIRMPYRAGGMLIGDPRAYRIEIHDGMRTLTTLSTSYVPAAITPLERAEWTASMERSALLDTARVNQLLPARKTAFRALWSDETGQVWVEKNSEALADSAAVGARATPTSIWRDRSTFDVYSGTGLLKVRVTLPPHTYLLAVSHSRLWLCETQADGGGVIGVYALQ